MIELVLTLPIFLTVIFAIVEYSVLLGAMLIMNNITSEAARQATVYRSGFGSGDYESIAHNVLRDSLPAYVGSFRESVMPSVNSFACGDSTCLQVRLDYPDYSRNPLVGNSFFIPLPERLSAESITRVEPNDG